MNPEDIDLSHLPEWDGTAKDKQNPTDDPDTIVPNTPEYE